MRFLLEILQRHKNNWQLVLYPWGPLGAAVTLGANLHPTRLDKILKKYQNFTAFFIVSRPQQIGGCSLLVERIRMDFPPLFRSIRRVVTPRIHASQQPVSRRGEPGPGYSHRWMYGYGLTQGSATAADSYVLLFGATLLTMSPTAVGLLDGIGTIGFTLAALSIAFLVLLTPMIHGLFTTSLLAMGLTFILFSVVESSIAAIVLALLFGIFLAPSVVLAPVLACQELTSSKRNDALSRLNRFSSLGGAAGIAATVLWLLGASLIGPADVTLRVLFVLLGIVAILAALYSYHSLRYSLAKQPGSSQPFTFEGPMSAGQRVISFKSILPGHVHRPLFTDQLVCFLALHFVLSVGFGMSFSGIHSYFVTELKVPIALAMGAFLGYKLTSFAVSGPMGEGMAQLLPLQALCLTSVLRVVAIVAVALAGIVLPDGLALATVLVAVTLWGISGGAMAVAGPANVIQLAVPHRWKQSIVLYLAISNGGALIGAIAGGMLANTFGFVSLFLIAAAVSGVATVLMMRN